MADTRGPALAGVAATFGAMAFITVLLRCYVRVRMVKAFGMDDYFMVGAVLMYVWYTADVLGGIHYGTGQHMSDLTPENTMRAMRYWWLCYLSYCATMTFAKISIGVFLLRVTVTKTHRVIIWTVMTITAVTGVMFLFVTLFQCSPVQYFWTRFLPDMANSGSCIDIDIIVNCTYTYGSICAMCDFTFGLLPFFLVWNLQMEKRVKILLAPILSMACIASCAVVIRMPFVKDFKNPDFLYATVDIAIWSAIECGLAITAGSLATLRPLFRRMLSQINTKYSSDRTPGTPGTPLDNLDSRKKRPGAFSLSHLTTRGEREDETVGFSESRKGAWRLADEESRITDARSGSSKSKGQWRIHVKEEFTLSDNKSDEVQLTAMR